MRALVAHASERGSTAELANWLATALTEAGIPATTAACGALRELPDVEVVVIAGALYLGRWHRDARRFVARHADALTDRHVWLCSTGPLDDSASRERLPAVPDVTRALQRARARGHRTFGGRLEAGTTGPVVGRVAALAAGDYRDRPAVEAWARELAATLGTDPPRHRP